jgi:glycosyltransferase involved in cell wall biosynthesis
MGNRPSSKSLCIEDADLRQSDGAVVNLRTGLKGNPRAGQLIFLDTNAPWVRSLALAVASDVSMTPALAVRAIRPHGPQFYRRSVTAVPSALMGCWKLIQPRYLERYAFVPGWRRFFALSTRHIVYALSRLIAATGPVEGIVYTLPQYAGVAERMTAKGVPGYYYAHDPFRFYQWPAEWTMALQKRMLAVCDTTFAISEALCDDLRQETQRPVIYSPNAVDSAFLNSLSFTPPVPRELLSLNRPIIGCIGQINTSYDWQLIEEVTGALSNMSFVFIGPIIETNSAERARIERLMLRRQNVFWLGAKPHNQLPAYVNSFDVLLSPLATNEHNNRRSPLRLYEYLGSKKPVVSTAVHEAYQHGELVYICENPVDCAKLINRVTAPGHEIDVKRRMMYIRAQTWESRARRLVECIRSSSLDNGKQLARAVDAH